MKVGYLKEIINDLPNDMEVFVGCQGYSNFDFENGEMYEDEDTFAIIHNDKVFITDSCAIEAEDGQII